GFRARAIRSRRTAVCVRLHGAHHQYRRAPCASHQPPLDHHGRRPACPRSAWPGGSGAAAAAGSRRNLRIHQRLSAEHPRGHHEGYLPLRGRERNSVRGAHPRIPAGHAPHAALTRRHAGIFPYLYMKRLLSLLCMPPLLAACSLTQVPPEPGQQAPAASPGAPSVTGPLVVPPLSALPDTPARALGGRFQRANWADLPSWSADDLSQLWPLFIRNCKGLMRPTSGNLAAPARAAPRVWQPVCAAAADLGQDPLDAATVREFVQTHLQPWRLSGADGRPAANTVTGYYE